MQILVNTNYSPPLLGTKRAYRDLSARNTSCSTSTSPSARSFSVAVTWTKPIHSCSPFARTQDWSSISSSNEQRPTATESKYVSETNATGNAPYTVPRHLGFAQGLQQSEHTGCAPHRSIGEPSCQTDTSIGIDRSTSHGFDWHCSFRAILVFLCVPSKLDVAVYFT